MSTYNSALLFHGVGVGKTCTAITVAESLQNVYDRPALVIVPKNLKGNFLL
jgi:hypothetical protein